MTRTRLQVEDLTIGFGSRPDVVHGVSFAVDAGRCLAIVGESGSGKTATAKALFRLLPDTARIGGRVVLDGVDVQSISAAELRRVRAERVGFVFQDPHQALNPARTIGSQLREILAVNARVRGKRAQKASLDLLASVGLTDASQVLSKYPHELSGGMAQRCIIAMALVCDPEVVIADEPTTALDVSVQRRILDLLRLACKDRGTSLILISHDLAMVSGIADDVVVMQGGVLVESGAAMDVLLNPQHAYTKALLAARASTSVRQDWSAFRRTNESALDAPVEPQVDEKVTA